MIDGLLEAAPLALLFSLPVDHRVIISGIISGTHGSYR